MMNQLIPDLKKVINVLKRIIYSVIPIAFICCASTKSKNDNDLLQVMVQDICKINEGKEFALYDKTDNSFFLKTFEENLKDSIFIKQELSKPSLTHGKVEINRENIAVLKEIFTEENYSYIKKQISKTTWDEKRIKAISSCAITLVDANERVKGTDRKLRLYINRPVYTKNGYALVQYSYKSISAISVFKKIKGKWSEVLHLPLGIS